jgi:3-methyladenine DNA glycosylase AlkD
MLVKRDIKQLLPNIEKCIAEKEYDSLVHLLQLKVLKSKIRFPILEYLGEQLFNLIPSEKQISFLDKIISLDELGSYVIAGKILQLRLKEELIESTTKANKYIVQGNEWYVCDIIGERVWGFALLTMPEETLPLLKSQSESDSHWLVRSVGVAGHYAVKKGLKREYVRELFSLLLTKSDATEFHTKRGIGWAAKTIAKFHPDIIEEFGSQLQKVNAENWFHAKIQIGLGRSHLYAERYTD